MVENYSYNKFHDGKYFTFYDHLHGTLLRKGDYTMDIDQVEYRSINQELTIVALLEVKERELNYIEQFYNDENFRKGQLIDFNKQLKIMHDLAEGINVDCYLILHDKDCSLFVVYFLEENRILGKYNRDEYYTGFLQSLKPRNN